ncbi:MAG: septum formation protein Maf [Cellvibrionales bacterium TMED148]|nr:septum formation protein Maf [Porticoccaceae bacterium]RPG89219.1 MAG: septum formation protein Maf [Cellvibrionales bacterium TMED148]
MFTVRTKMNHIILASSSRYRAKLLDQIGISYRTITPNIDETPKRNETATNLSTRLSIEKAIYVARQQRGTVVVGSDQAAELEGEIIGKPANESLAIKQMQKQSGKKVKFFSACAVAKLDRMNNLEVYSAISETIVEFRKLSYSQIANYIRIDQPYDCTGSFKAEGLGIILCAAIQSDDPSALIGLPLIKLIDLLKNFKIDYV